jgi:putative Holliday junction resolvase
MKRIGLAQSDPTRTIASPVGTFSETELFSRIELHQHEIELVIVGWPLSLKGNENTSTEMVTAFVNRFSRRFPAIRVQLLDERYTSTMATHSIREMGSSRKKRQQKGLVDTIAAAILLQNFLDKK